jgi:hypothetical protein
MEAKMFNLKVVQQNDPWVVPFNYCAYNHVAYNNINAIPKVNILATNNYYSCWYIGT